jgi:hypothetical protein
VALKQINFMQSVADLELSARGRKWFSSVVYDNVRKELTVLVKRTYNATDKEFLPKAVWYRPDAAPETEFKPGIPRGDVGLVGVAAAGVAGREGSVSMLGFTLLANETENAFADRIEGIAVEFSAKCNGLKTYEEVVQESSNH